MCIMHFSFILFQFVSEGFLPRDRETHASHCSSLGMTTMLQLMGYIEILFLISHHNNFHVTEGLVPDIMHDCLEGCLPYAVKRHLFQSDVISLTTLNEIMLAFPYKQSNRHCTGCPMLPVIFHLHSTQTRSQVKNTVTVYLQCSISAATSDIEAKFGRHASQIQLYLHEKLWYCRTNLEKIIRLRSLVTVGAFWWAICC